jgi:ferredoxin
MAYWPDKKTYDPDQAYIKACRDEAPKFDARRAVREICRTLSGKNKSFVWTPFKDPNGKEMTWLFRVPTADAPDAVWLDEDAASIVHMCRPTPLWEAIVEGNEERTIAHSGYVLLDDEGVERCVRCKRECPPKVSKRLRSMLKLFTLQRATRGA